jgi:hypothetical protein
MITDHPLVRALRTACVVVMFSCPRAFAQTPVADVLTFLVTNQSVASGSVERDQAAAEATSETISRALLANLATQPVMTSTSAFIYRLNPALGTVERATPSFGPFFVERGLTAGAGRASFGLTMQHLRYTKLEGRRLDDATLVTTATQFVDEADPFDVDRLRLHITADVTTLYGNVGLTDHLDIGFAAPLVVLRLDGDRTNTYRGKTFTQAAASATAIGLADLVVRSKYMIFDVGGERLAAAVDVRLPTGRREDLLGSGSTSVRLSAIGSLETGRVAGHANAAIAVGGLARELDGGAAVELAAGNRVTFSGELLARLIDTPGGIASSIVRHPVLAGVNTLRLVPDTSTLTVITVVPGVKWNLSSTWVLGASVAVPLTQGGLTAPITPFVGLDYVIPQ